MKIYTGYPGGITKITNDKGFYQTEDLVNVISVYVNQADVTGITYTLALEFLRADGRKTTIYTEDRFASGEATTLTEENVTYDIHNFTLTDTQLAVAGALAFTCYINILNSGVIEKRGVLFNAVSNVRKTVLYSANTIFVVSEDEEDVPIIVADMKTAIETLSGQLASKVNKADVADDLTTNDSSKVLSAKQGYVLKAMLDALDDSKADKATTYNKDEVDEKDLNLAAQMASDKLELNNRINTTNGILTATQAEVAKLKSVQNVVEVVATKSALNSYDTTKLDANDKVQVITDETHDGASTIYNWSGSAWQYVGAYGTNSYTKPETLEQINIHKLINKTYSELATLKANNGLVAGQKYRITDYVTTTNRKCNGVDDDVRSVEHPFDVIVTAISVNEFSENARAIQHTGDSYFANSKLEAWRLWYSFENDTNRFEWADTTNGKGVIYRMIDEFQNDVPYDFKNIQFKRYKITGVTDSRQNRMLDKYLGFNGNYNVTSDSTDFVWRFTFSKRADNSDLSLVEVNNTTFTSNAYVKQVVIGEYITDNPTYRCKQALNNIVMEVEALIVDIEMGNGSHHNTWIGNEDIDYCYFASMFRNNILFGEINHTRADECFEQNVIGEGSYTLYASCWNKFSHHFSRNIGINMQSNDFEGQVDGTKFPEHFTRNHINNMLSNVDFSTHDTFNGCSLGYAVECTFGGAGTWDGVVIGKLFHVSISINILFGSTISRMEYVNIHQQQNTYNIVNLYIGSLFGASTKPLTIDLTDLYNYQLTSAYAKRIDYAWDELSNARCLFYSVAIYDTGSNMVYYNYVKGNIVSTDYSVNWSETKSVPTRIQEIYDGLFNIKMAKQNPTGTGTFSMNDGTASGTNSYANGSGATASGNFSKAVGFGATASGNYSTAVNGTASGNGSVAYGNGSNASGDGSFALGTQLKAKGNNQIVTGKFNIPDTTSLEIVGNGAYMNTKNARLLDSNGNEYLAGNLYINTTFTKDGNGDLSAKNGTKITDYVNNAINDLRWELGSHTLDVTTDSDTKYIKSVPSGAIGCQINQIGGMSYKSENLFNIENGTYQSSGLSLVKNNNGFSLSGTPSSTGWISFTTITLPAGTYFLKAFGTFNSNSNFGLINSSYQSVTWINSTTSFTLGTEQTLSLAITGTNYNNYGGFTDVQIMLVSGSTAPTTYKPYFSGIRNTAVSQLTIRGANLLQLSDVPTTTRSGITYSVSNNTIKISGTATYSGSYDFITNNLSSDTYSCLINFVRGSQASSTEPSIYIRNSDNSYIDYFAPNKLTSTFTNSVGYIRVSWNNGSVLDLEFNFMLVSGSTVPTEYKPYVTPIIKNIPSQIQALTGYGWGIDNTCYNYIDFERKVFVQKVARVDLSTLNYSRTEWGANYVFQTILSMSNSNNLLCSIYDTATPNYIYANAVDKSITNNSNAENNLKIVDNSYSDATTFKNAMSGIYLYYELETPIETDISAYLTTDTLDVEPNGTLELTNTYSQDVPSDIDYLIEEVKA